MPVLAPVINMTGSSAMARVLSGTSARAVNVPAVPTRRLIALTAALLALAAPAPALAATDFAGVHAHRGGPLTNGQAGHPEASLEAFESARRIGADVVEMDAKLTSDNVPIVMHDDTLDRTTNCTGQVRQKTAAEIAANCRIDTIGIDDKTVPATGSGVAVPTLAQALDWARRTRTKLHLEIKNLPTDTDFDPTPGFAQTVLNAIVASGIPTGQVLIQSFWPSNLDEAKARGFQTALLTVKEVSNSQSIDLAVQKGYTVVAPAWPTAQDPKEYVKAAHAAGKPVIPWTIDDAAQMKSAIDAGVDGLITNDPRLGLTTWYKPACDAAKAQERRRLKAYRTAQARYRAARGAVRKRELRAKAASARRAYDRQRRARVAVCAKSGG
jgi:glycerophosphoryl diester phosphodiesterase